MTDGDRSTTSHVVQPCPAIRLLATLLWASMASISGVSAGAEPTQGRYCNFTPPGDTNRFVPGLIVGANVLLPDGHRPDHAVHLRFNGTVGAVKEFDALRSAYPDAAVLDCRGRAVLSPGFVNAHEHPAYSYDFPHRKLNPDNLHRDEWRFGLNGKAKLTSPWKYDFEPGNRKAAAILVSVELRHLIGGATAIAGSGGVPGVIRNINRHERRSDLGLYDAEADVVTFPFSYRVVEDLKDECAGGPAHRFPPAPGGDFAFMAYVPHVGEGRTTSCAAKAEVARYLKRVERRDRRYSLVHGVSTDREDYARMSEFDVSLVWSPRSNLALYGQTVDFAGALEHGVRIALSTDWSPSGSFNMREEVRCARQVAKSAGVALPSEALWRMSTVNGAYALGLEDKFGAIEAGMRADLILVKYAGGNPYDAVLNATDKDILATWVDGRAVLLSEMLDQALSDRECVTLDGVAPRVCGVLDEFGLPVRDFGEFTKGNVPLNATNRQAPCRVRH